MFENVFVNVQLYNVQNVNWMILRPGWLGLRPVWLGLRPGWLGLRPGWMAQRGDVRTNERTNKRTNGRKISPFYRTSSPIGAAAQKLHEV